MSISCSSNNTRPPLPRQLHRLSNSTTLMHLQLHSEWHRCNAKESYICHGQRTLGKEGVYKLHPWSSEEKEKYGCNILWVKPMKKISVTWSFNQNNWKNVCTKGGLTCHGLKHVNNGQRKLHHVKKTVVICIKDMGVSVCTIHFRIYA